jgi:hypothetical protein
MIVRLAVRSLAVRPIRTAVLACGFGLGIAVMAALLGVGDVILEQARSPELQGGGDLLVFGTFGPIENAPFVLGGVRNLVPAASPAHRATIYLIKERASNERGSEREPSAERLVIPVVARGGVPSLEKAIGDGEVKDMAAWRDTAEDERWKTIDRGAQLRAFDRFHKQPDVPELASSWAEWLYFNGRTSDARTRFYLTFIIGPIKRPGARSAGVRLQLDRDGQSTSYAAAADVDERTVLDKAPDLDIGASSVRLEGTRYRISLRLPGVSGDLVLDPDPGRSLPPAVLRGARGWLSGYVVPVLSGRLSGFLDAAGSHLSFADAAGYHDHNWGFWKDVRWQWGQVAGPDLSFIYGRVFPPADVAAVDRLPGFLGILDKSGLVGIATNVAIEERRPRGEPRGAPVEITVTGRAPNLDLRLSLAVDRVVRTAMAMTGGANDFLQMGGTYRVEGTAAGRTVDFTARGAAETFQPR